VISAIFFKFRNILPAYINIRMEHLGFSEWSWSRAAHYHLVDQIDTVALAELGHDGVTTNDNCATRRIGSLSETQIGRGG
jgi:hypothetical protein